MTLLSVVAQSSTTFHVPTTFPPQGNTLPQFVPSLEFELPHASGQTAPIASPQMKSGRKLIIFIRPGATRARLGRK
jgi:hypothetical protein